MRRRRVSSECRRSSCSSFSCISIFFRILSEYSSRYNIDDSLPTDGQLRNTHTRGDINREIYLKCLPHTARLFPVWALHLGSQKVVMDGSLFMDRFFFLENESPSCLHLVSCWNELGSHLWLIKANYKMDHMQYKCIFKIRLIT